MKKFLALLLTLMLLVPSALALELSAVGVMPLTAEDGKLSAPFVTDAYREGLHYINKLVKEGLISELSYSQTDAEMRSIMQAPNDQDSLVGVLAGHSSPMFGTDVRRTLDYIGLPSLAGHDGTKWAPLGTQLGAYNTFITADCENPELAYRFIDACNKLGLSIAIRFGVGGQNFEYVDGGPSRYSGIGDDYVALYQQFSTADNPAH